MNIKEMVADGRKVRCLHYRLGMFMRYIRKHVAYLEEARRAQHEPARK